MPGVYCAVASCRNGYLKCRRNDNKLGFFKIPKDDERRRLWIAACQRTDSFNPNTSRVCSEHFSMNDFERDIRAEMGFAKFKHKLKETAVPSLNLLPEKLQTPRVPSLRAKRRQAKDRKKLVNGLPAESDNNPLHLNKVRTDGLDSRFTSSDLTCFKEKYEQLLEEYNKLKKDYEILHNHYNLEISRYRRSPSDKGHAKQEFMKALSMMFTPNRKDLFLEKYPKEWPA